MNNIKIRSFKEFYNIIEKYNKNSVCWFRGQVNADYFLQPGAYRDLYAIEDYYYRPICPTPINNDYNNRGTVIFLPGPIYLKLFKKIIGKRNIEDVNSMDDIYVECIGQHYGLKTRLLDWSTDVMVALFFATDNPVVNQDAAFFIMRPDIFNKAIGCNHIPNADSINNRGRDKMFPIAFYGPKNSKRICRQSGNFTMHGENVWPLERYHLPEDAITKVILPYKICLEIKDFLNVMGVNKEEIYVENDIREEIAKEVIVQSELIIRKELDLFKKNWENTSDMNKGINIYELSYYLNRERQP